MPPSKYSTLILTNPLTPKNPATLLLKPVTSKTDVPSLATINERALDADPLFKQWMTMFTERTEYGTTVNAVTEALDDPEYRLVKAVVTEDGGEEKIVGFIHWFCGFIQLEKVDPFAKRVGKQSQSQNQDQSSDQTAPDPKDPTSVLLDQLSTESTHLTHLPTPTTQQLTRARRLQKGERKYIETRNHYIAAIRGKRHMFIRRIMVLPEYQGMGIGKQLMCVVTDEADRLKIVCWLFARPMGVRMYEGFGYVTVGVTDMDEPEEEGFRCPETRSMLRVARPVKVDGS